jgi:hypothetical protein
MNNLNFHPPNFTSALLMALIDRILIANSSHLRGVSEKT